MKSVKRALLYITRQGFRSSLLLLILALMLSVSLIGFSITTAANAMMRQMQQDVGGFLVVQGDGESAFVDADAVAALQGMDGVQSVDTKSGLRMVFPDLTFVQSEGVMPGTEHLAMVEAHEFTDKSDYFLYGTMRMKQGDHITPESGGQIMLSEDVAFTSGLFLGAKVNGYWRTGADTYDEANPYEFTIVGIYSMANPTDMPNAQVWEMPVNTVFIDNDTLHAIRQDYDDIDYEGAQRYASASVFVTDPLQLSSIAGQIEKILGDGYTVTVDDSVYQSMAVPLNRIITLVRILLVVTLSIFCVMLLLIAALWVRNRAYEIGVYLALGIEKKSIVRQLFIEMLIIALIAVLVACPVALSIGGKVSDSLYTAVEKQVEAQEAIVDDAGGKEVVLLTGVHFESKVSPAAIVLTAAMGVGITLLSTIVSALQILYMQPKKILSMMS